MLDFVEVFKLIVALYPKEKELNYDKLVKITYLIDWRSAIVQKKQTQSGILTIMGLI